MAAQMTDEKKVLEQAMQQALAEGKAEFHKATLFAMSVITRQRLTPNANPPELVNLANQFMILCAAMTKPDELKKLMHPEMAALLR